MEPVRCMQCGYNLQMLTREDACPECGTPARESMRDDLLQLYPQQWIRKLKWAAMLMVVVLLYGPVVHLITFALYSLTGFASLYLQIFGFLPMVWLMLVACWILTAQPKCGVNAMQRNVAIVVRIVLIVTLIVAHWHALILYSSIAPFYWLGWGFPGMWFYRISFLGTWASIALLAAGFTWYVYPLLMRVPATRLAKWVLIIGLIAAGGLFFTGATTLMYDTAWSFYRNAGVASDEVNRIPLVIVIESLEGIVFGLTQIALVWLSILTIRAVRLLGSVLREQRQEQAIHAG